MTMINDPLMQLFLYNAEMEQRDLSLERTRRTVEAHQETSQRKKGRSSVWSRLWKRTWRTTADRVQSRGAGRARLSGQVRQSTGVE